MMPPSWVVRARRNASTLALLVWAALVLAVVGTISGAHLLTLPSPSRTDTRLATALAVSAGHSWSMTHFLRADCRCSMVVAAHLAQRGPRAEVRERVMLVGDDAATRQRLESAGFTVQSIDDAGLATTFGVEAVPLLVVADDRGELRYVGGYTARKQGPTIADLSVLRALQAGMVVEPLPLFGCPTSERLKRLTDPLGVR